MEKLGDITIFVLDYDPNGADNLGFFKLGLDQVTHSRARARVCLRVRVRVNLPTADPTPTPTQVTNSAYRRLEKDGHSIKTRVFEHDALPLAQPGMKATQGTMHIQARYLIITPSRHEGDPRHHAPAGLLHTPDLT